jgi:hypothetical protein
MDGQLYVCERGSSIDPCPEKTVCLRLLKHKEKDPCMALGAHTTRERKSREQSLTPLCKGSGIRHPR